MWQNETKLFDTLLTPIIKNNSKLMKNFYQKLITSNGLKKHNLKLYLSKLSIPQNLILLVNVLEEPDIYLILLETCHLL